ncbi:MAG: PD-(D/E)XK nuclease family protein [Clostridia bacterium]|nr:PD-(D/E)XK nuclease family protein [Clostridia bacterium]
MLKFILGGAGCGKTYRITEMIKEDIAAGRRAILLVPEQETVARERAMLGVLGPSAQLSFEVLNFTRLANSVFRKYGGLTYSYVTSGVKSLAMWNTLRSLAPLLLEYGGLSGDAAFGSMMLSQIEEFKAYGISPTALERAAKKAEKGSRISAKLNDLALIYSAYSASIEAYGAGDPSDDIGKLAAKLAEHDFFPNINVYIDSFTSFTSSEEEVIFHILRQANKTVVSLCIAHEGVRGGLQFESIAHTLKNLERLAERSRSETEKEILIENHRTADPALRRLSEDIWRFDADIGNTEKYDTGSVKLIKCTNIYEEAEAASSAVSELIHGGMRYRDIVILARNAKTFEGIIDNALEKEDIPYFMSKTSDVTAMPLAKLLLCAFRIKNTGWRTEDVITYIKTGLTGLEERTADLFEQYIWKWSIKGKAFIGDDWTMDPDSYSSETDEKGRAVLMKVNEGRRHLVTPLLTLYEKIDEAGTNEDICRAVFEYMEELCLADRMRAFSAACLERGDKQSSSEALRLYNTVLDVLGVIAKFDSGESRYDSSEFEQALRIVLSQTGLGSIPTSCDEVTVGSASLLRADSPKCVILIGVNDGVFPESASENRMLTDEDKLFLSENGIELSPGSEERSSEELFYVYRAVTAPSEKLIMTYSASELQGGKELRPSLAFNRAKLLLGLGEIDYASLPYEKKLWSEKVAFEYAALAEGEAGAALKRYFSESEEYSERLRSLYIPIGERECRVPSEMSDMIFGRNMSFSPSALEKYVKCHFDYWCEYVLRLRPDEKNVFSLSDTGSLIHALLEKFIEIVTDENGFNARRAEEEAEDIIEELMRLYIEENFPERDAKKQQVAHVINKLKHLSRLLAKNITEELKTSKFVPSFFELEINGKKPDALKPLEFTLTDGSTVSIKGIVDRVDLFRDGNDVYVKVVDYKTGSKEFRLEDVKDGLNLQMLLYLFSICGKEENKAMMGCDGDLKPAGVVYLSSRVSGITEKSGADRAKIEEAADDKLSRSGILLADEDIQKAVNEDMKYVMSGYGSKSRKKKDICFKTEEEIGEIRDTISEALTRIFGDLRSGNACIEPRSHEGRFPCEYCRMKAVCRRGHIKEEYENEDDLGGGED